MFNALIFGLIFSREDYGPILFFFGGLSLHTQYS